MSNQKRRRVIVIEHCRHSVDDAAALGDIHHLFERGERHASIWSDDFIAQVHVRLQEMSPPFDPALDYVVLMGSVIVLTSVVAHLCCTYGFVDAACYDAQTGQYRPKTLGEKRHAATVNRGLQDS